MDIPELFLSEGIGRVASAGVENGYVLVELFEVLQSVRFGSTAVDYRSPGGQNAEFSVSRCLRIRRDDGNSGANQVRPVFDVPGISFADDEDNRRSVRLGFIWQALGPAVGDQPPLMKRLDIGAQRQGDDIGGHAIDDRLRLAR